jgi:hypothetical protein
LDYPGSGGNSWVTVQFIVDPGSQRILLSLNGTQIMNFNDAPFTYDGGKVGLGVADTFASVADDANFYLFDNLEVEELLVAAEATQWNLYE